MLRLQCGAPSDQFLRILYDNMGVSFGSVSSLTMCAPSDQFLHILYGGPLRSVSLLAMWGPSSSHTIWGPPQTCFFFLLYGGPPQVSFFYFLHGGTLGLVSSLTKYESPLRSVSSLTIWRPPQINFYATMWGPL